MSNLNTKVLFISCIADKVNSPLYWKKKSKVDVSSSDYVQTLSGTLWTATAQNWNKTFTHIEYRAGAVDQKGLVNVFFLSLFQSSLLLIYFLYCPNTCSHYTSVALVYYTAVFSVVTSRNAPARLGKERCVTTL